MLPIELNKGEKKVKLYLPKNSTASPVKKIKLLNCNLFEANDHENYWM